MEMNLPSARTFDGSLPWLSSEDCAEILVTNPSVGVQSFRNLARASGVACWQVTVLFCDIDGFEVWAQPRPSFGLVEPEKPHVSRWTVEQHDFFSQSLYV